MITRASISYSARRLGLVHRSHACSIWRQIRQSGCGIVSRRPSRPQEGNVSGPGSDAVQCPDIWSADLGCLEGDLIRRSIPVSRALTRPGSFGGKAAKRTMGQVPVPYRASHDQCVRWGSVRRIKCPGSCGHASLSLGCHHRHELD